MAEPEHPGSTVAAAGWRWSHATVDGSDIGEEVSADEVGGAAAGKVACDASGEAAATAGAAAGDGAAGTTAGAVGAANADGGVEKVAVGGVAHVDHHGPFERRLTTSSIDPFSCSFDSHAT